MRRCALGIVLATALASATAAEDGTGFWGAVDVGAASLERTHAQTGSTRNTEFAMAFRGGYAWDPRLLLGFELGGFTLEESDLSDPSSGEGIQTFYAIAHYYPGAASKFFLRAGFGHASSWNNRPGESGASGSGYVLGAGYEVERWGAWRLEPIVEFAAGKLDQRYQAVTLRLALSYR